MRSKRPAKVDCCVVPSDPAVSPLMQQFREAKARHPDMLLLYLVGKWVQAFGPDAEDVGKVMSLGLTDLPGAGPVARVPREELEAVLRKLLAAGHRVALCEVEDKHE